MALLPNEKLITTKEAGELSGYTSDYLSRLVRSGKIAGKKVGHSWLVDKESLNRFLGEQDDHKSDRARELARARAREYRVHRSVVLRAAKALTEPRSMPQQFVRVMSALPSRAALRRLRSHALAFSVALLVLTFGTLGAQAEMLPRFAQNAAAVAEQTALGLEATFGDIPSHIAQRFTDVEREMRTHFSRTATTGTAASARIAPRVLRNLSVSLSFGQPEKTSSDRAAFSIRAASASKAAVPAVTAGDIRAFAADAYAVFTSPSRITDAAANAYVSVGEEAYGAIRAALAAYRSTLDEFGARTLSAAAVARDTLRAAPEFVARTNLALGESVIAAARFVLDAEIAASYGLAAAAPASARATVALVGGTGDLLAGFTVRAAVEAPSRLARAILDASEAGAKIPEAVFSAEYAAATGFIAATNAVSGRYALALARLGEVGYESARGSRALVQSIPAEIRHPRQLQPSDLEHAGAALASAVSDAYRGALDKTSLAFDTFARTPKVAAVLNSPPMRALERAGEAGLAAALPALSAGEKAALAIYNTIHGFFTFTTDSLANLFMPPPTIVYPVYPIAAPARPKVVTAPAPRTSNSYTTIVRGVSEDFVNQSLNSLRSSLLATIADSIRPVYMQTVTNAATTQQVNMIQDLHDLIVRNGDFRNSIFDNGIRVSATDGRFTNLYGGSASLSSLTVSGATSLATTTITGDLSVSGSITPSVISASDYIRAPYFVATSTTATSTFAGSLAIDTNGFVYATSTKNVGIGVLSPAALLAVQNSTSTQPIFVASSAAGSEVYRITNAGFVGIGTTTPGYNLAVEGSSSLGNQAIAGYFTATSTTATSTFAGRLAVGTSTPWGDGLFTIGTTTPLLYIERNSGRIGIGTSSPLYTLDIVGTLNASGATTFGGTLTTSATSTATYFSASTLGTVGAPAYTFSSDLTTGLWSPIASTLALSTGGAERLRIDSSGNIGIATTSPYAKLSVVGQVVASYFTATTSTASTFPYASTTMLTAVTASTTNLIASAAVTFQNLVGMLSSNGISGTSARTLTGTANQITIANGDGTGGNPTFSLPSLLFITNASSTALSSLDYVSVGRTATTTFVGDYGTSTLRGPLDVYGNTTSGAGSTLTLQRGSTNGDNSLIFNDQTGSPLLKLYTSANTGYSYLNGQQSFLSLGMSVGGEVLRIDTSNNARFTGNVIPSANQTYNLGTPAVYWNNAYLHNIVANNLSSASTSIAGTNNTSFSINSNNPTSDAQDMSLIFYRGSGAPTNAVLSWNSTLKRFEFNQNAYIANASASTGSTTLRVAAVAGQTGALTSWLDSSGNVLATVTASGNIGVGTTTPYSKLTAWGAGSLFEAVTNASTTVFSIGQGGATSTSLFASRLTANTFSAGQTASTTIDSAGNLATAGTLQVTGQTTLATSLSGLLAGSSGVVYSTATSSLAIGSSLSNSGTLGAQIGGTASSLSLNMANANSWTALQSFLNASSTLFSNTGTAYFGGTATSTFDSAGNLSVGGTLSVAGLCVTGDTRLRRRRKARKGEEDEADEDGYIYDEVMIKDIKEGDEIQSLDEKTGKLVWSRVKQLAYMGKKQTYKLVTASGKTIRTTANHPYLARKAKNKASPRAVAFIDFANVKAGYRDRGYRTIDLEVLYSALSAAGVTTTRFYYGTDVRNEKSSSFFTKIASFGYAVVTKPVQYFNISFLGLLEKPFNRRWIEALPVGLRANLLREAGRLDMIGVRLLQPKANFDVEITTDALKLADIYDDFILFSGDGDFVPLVKRLRELGRNVTVVSDRKYLSGELLLAADKFVTLGLLNNFVPGLLLGDGGVTQNPPRGRVLKKGLVSIADLLGLSSAQKADVDNPVKHGEGSWRKVAELKEGMEIAVADSTGSPQAGGAAWERIVSVEPVAEEDVYDIEVEGTHNFIGNGIVAHNTAVFNQASSTLFSANSAYFGATATSSFSSAGVLTLATDLAVTEGGTGASTLTGLLQGNGTSAITGITNSSTAGQVLRVTGASTYAWGALDLADTDAITGDLPFANLAQVSANSVLGNITGSTADATSIATSSLFTWTGTGDVVRATSPTLTTPNLGTPSALVLTNATGLPVAGGGTGATTFSSSQLLYGAGTGAVQSVATSSLAVGTGLTNSGTLGAQVGGANASISFAAINANSLWANNTGASAVPTNIATSSLFTWNGTGDVVRTTSPTLVTPTLGVASATSINKLTLTTPATSATLTIIDGKTLTINKTISFTSADDTGVYTLPTGTKTLVATDVTTLSSLASIGTITTGVWNGTDVAVADGGTGASTLTGLLQGNGASAITGITGTAGQFPYYNGTNTLLATSTIFLSTTGNIGIGTTTPYSRLSVWGDGTGATAMFELTNSASTTLASVLNDGTVYMKGNVGIGTTNPSRKFSLTGDATIVGNTYINPANFIQWEGGQYWTWRVNGSQFEMYRGDTGVSPFYANSSNQVIMNQGNVGIGTTGPGTKLEILDGFLSLTDTDVAHGMTDFAATNAYFRAELASGTAGGAYLTGLSDTGAVSGFQIFGVIGSTDPTDSVPAIAFNGAKKSAGTGSQALGSLETVLAVRNNAADLVTVLGSGNVGIGTTNPPQLLTVRKDQNGITELLVRNDTSGTAASERIRLSDDVFSSLYLQRFSPGYTTSGRHVANGGLLEFDAAGGLSIAASQASASIRFYQNGDNERMRIDSSGNVGIGTTSPMGKLTIQDTGNTRLDINADSTTGQQFLSFDQAGTARWQLISNYSAAVNGIEFDIRDTTVGANRLHIDSSGNVGIGTTDPGTYKLNVNGTMNVSGPSSASISLQGYRSLSTDASDTYIGNLDLSHTLRLIAGGATQVLIGTDGSLTITTTPSSGGNTGLCWDAAGASIWGGCTSLGALKTNVEDLSLGLDALRQLRPVQFEWKSNLGVQDLGFIAEEVEAVNPLLAEYNGPDGALSGVKYNTMTALLAKAIQELDAKVDLLAASSTIGEYIVNNYYSTSTTLSTGTSSPTYVTNATSTTADLSGYALRSDLGNYALRSDLDSATSSLASLTTNYQLLTTNFSSALEARSSQLEALIPAPVSLGNLYGTAAGDIIPNVNNAYSLGSPTNKFSHVYAQNLIAGDLGFSETTSAVSGNTLTAGDVVALYISATGGACTAGQSGTCTVPIDFRTAINTTNYGANNVYFNTSGSLAIGVASSTAPRGKLDVEAAIASGDARYLTLANTSGANGNAALTYSMYIPSSTGDLNFASNDNNGALVNDSYSAWNLKIGGQTDAFSISRSPSGTLSYANFFNIKNNGNVGIGTTTPYSRLSVWGGGTGATSMFELTNSASTTLASVLNDGTFYMKGNVGIGTTNPLALLQVSSIANTRFVLSDSNSAATSKHAVFNSDGGTLTIGYAADDLSGQLPTLSVLYTGNVGIGTTAPDSIKLDVEDDIEIGTGTTGCVRDADNTTLVGTCVSDERLKKNIAGLSAGTLDKLAQLRPVTFEWRNDEFDWLNGQEGVNYGLIAQEVEPIFPDMIHTDDRGYKRVSYDIGLSMRLLEGIRELDARTRQILGAEGVLSVVPGVESQCVTGDTKLRRRRRRSDGSFEFDEVEIKNVVAGDEIASLDERTNRVVYSRVNALVDMGEQEVYELVTKSGRRIRTTSNHPFLARIASTSA